MPSHPCESEQRKKHAQDAHKCARFTLCRSRSFDRKRRAPNPGRRAGSGARVWEHRFFQAFFATWIASEGAIACIAYAIEAFFAGFIARGA
jgi:hypothetical protein